MKRLVTLLLPLVLVACDEDPTDPFDPEITGSIGAFDTESHTFTAPESGTLTAVLSWPDQDIDLDLYLTDADCTGYPPDDCTILASSTGVTGNEEFIEEDVDEGERYKLWVDSWSDESSTYLIEVDID